MIKIEFTTSDPNFWEFFIDDDGNHHILSEKIANVLYNLATEIRNANLDDGNAISRFIADEYCNKIGSYVIEPDEVPEYDSYGRTMEEAEEQYKDWLEEESWIKEHTSAA